MQNDIQRAGVLEKETEPDIGNGMATRSVNVVVKARDDASKKFGKIGKSAGGLSSSLKGLAVAAAAAFGIRAIKSFVSNTLDSIDALAKMSARINITADDLRGLRMAATQAGASNASLDKALEKMAKNLGEAAGGTGEAIRGLDMLGLSAKTLVDAGPAEAFKLIADKISEMGNQSEKAAAASFIFGRAGIQLVNVLDSGSDAIDEMIKKSTELSGTLTKKQLKAVEDSNDAWDDFNRALTGTGEQIVSAMAPALESLANSLTALIKFTETATFKIGALFIGITAAIVIVPKLAAAFWTLVAAAKALVITKTALLALSGWGIAVVAVAAAVTTAAVVALNSALDDTLDANRELVKSEDEVTDAIKRNTRARADAVKELEKYRKDTKRTIESELSRLQKEIANWGMTKTQVMRELLEVGVATATTSEAEVEARSALKRFGLLVDAKKELQRIDKDAANEKKKELKLAERALRMAKDRIDVARQARGGDPGLAGMAGGVQPTVPGAQPQALAARESRFLSGVTFGRGGATPEQTTADNTKQMVGLLKDQKAILKDVKKNTTTIIPEGILELVTSRMA